MRGAATLLLASLLAACAQLPERVILLPDAGGRSGALQLQPLEGAQSPLLLNQAMPRPRWCAASCAPA